MKTRRSRSLATLGIFAILFGSAGVAVAADAGVQASAEALARPAVAGGTVAGAGLIGFFGWLRPKLAARPSERRTRRKQSVKLLYFP